MATAPGITGEKIWLDGRMVDWEDARVHILTHTLHYGLGVFEGIRCYRTDDGRSAVFRLPEHVRRLFESAHINLLRIPYSQEELREAALETLNADQPHYRRIRGSLLVRTPFGPESGLVTANGKLKRAAIHAALAPSIDELYERNAAVSA